MRLVDKAYFCIRNYFASKLPALYGFCDERKRLLKFFTTGVLTGASDLFFLYIFHGLLAFPIIEATSFAFIFSFLLSFFLQKKWTFRNQERGRVVHQLASYFFNAFIGLILNGLMMHLLVNRLEWWYILAQLLVNAAIGTWNFFVYKFVIFKKSPIYENRDNEKPLGR